MQTTLLKPADVKVIELTELDVITRVRSYVLERKSALMVYKFSKGTAEKLGAVEELLIHLAIAAEEAKTNSKQATRTVLRCSLDLHFIAPTSTRKIFSTWHTKIESIMQACRHYLSLNKQII